MQPIATYQSEHSNRMYKMSNTCPGSNIKSSVSDLSVITRKAYCPKCGKRLRITIPSKDNGNTAKFPKHAKQERNRV